MRLERLDELWNDLVRPEDEDDARRRRCGELREDLPANRVVIRGRNARVAKSITARLPAVGLSRAEIPLNTREVWSAFASRLPYESPSWRMRTLILSPLGVAGRARVAVSICGMSFTKACAWNTSDGDVRHNKAAGAPLTIAHLPGFARRLIVPAVAHGT